MTCDNVFDLFVNGVKVGSGDTWTTTYHFNPSVKPGDVITAVNGKTVGNVSELLSAVAALKPGVAAPLSVQRAGKTSDISVTPAKRQRPKAQN